MTVSLLGLGTACPPHCMTQQEATQLFSDIVCEDERQRRLAKVLFRKAEVETRYTVVPHKVAYNWCQDVSGIDQLTEPIDRAVPSQITPHVVPGESKGPTTRERMELFARFASDLAVRSSEQALAQAGLQAQQITHLVVVTCTGFDAPGVDIELIERLGLPRTTQRVQVGFMGCHGAVNGL
ncbi:MAG: type III polyketide synthase, partial [Aureliella sp.]